VHERERTNRTACARRMRAYCTRAQTERTGRLGRNPLSPQAGGSGVKWQAPTRAADRGRGDGWLGIIYLRNKCAPPAVELEVSTRSSDELSHVAGRISHAPRSTGPVAHKSATKKALKFLLTVTSHENCSLFLCVNNRGLLPLIKLRISPSPLTNLSSQLATAYNGRSA
jgi:hypothetical protein